MYLKIGISMDFQTKPYHFPVATPGSDHGNGGVNNMRPLFVVFLFPFVSPWPREIFILPVQASIDCLQSKWWMLNCNMIKRMLKPRLHSDILYIIYWLIYLFIYFWYVYSFIYDQLWCHMMPKFHQVPQSSQPLFPHPDRPEAPLLIFSFFLLALTMKRRSGNLAMALFFAAVQPYRYYSNTVLGCARHFGFACRFLYIMAELWIIE